MFTHSTIAVYQFRNIWGLIYLFYVFDSLSSFHFWSGKEKKEGCVASLPDTQSPPPNMCMNMIDKDKNKTITTF